MMARLQPPIFEQFGRLDGDLAATDDDDVTVLVAVGREIGGERARALGAADDDDLVAGRQFRLAVGDDQSVLVEHGRDGELVELVVGLGDRLARDRAVRGNTELRQQDAPSAKTSTFWAAGSPMMRVMVSAASRFVETMKSTPKAPPDSSHVWR